MAQDTYKFRVGLFVILSTVIGVGLLIWLGAIKYFQETRLYATYFDESVQGLEIDAAVRYRGVAIGRVEALSVAPDGHLIEVLMNVEKDVKIANDMRARLMVAGITGMKYVEIDRIAAGAEDRTPELTFKTRHPIIPANPSEIRELIFALEDIYKKIMSIDLKGISDGIKVGLDNINRLFSGGKLDRILANLERTSRSIRNATEKMDRVVNEETLKETIVHIGGAADDLHAITSNLDKQLDGLDFKKDYRNVSGKLDTMVDKGAALMTDVRRLIAELEMNLSLTIENLEMVSENLYRFSLTLEEHPSRLLFGEPPKREE